LSAISNGAPLAIAADTDLGEEVVNEPLAQSRQNRSSDRVDPANWGRRALGRLGVGKPMRLEMRRSERRHVWEGRASALIVAARP